MQEISRKYRLRRFSSSNDPDYHAAIAVYLSTVTPDIRTSSNQIAYWLDRTYREFGDEFCVCGFYHDDTIIGFAEFAFFRQDAVLFLDYLSLHPDHESQSEYLQFTRMIREWVGRQPFEFDFAATEITFETSSSEPTERTLLEVQLYKQMGFGVAHCKYRQPPLGATSPQSDLPAHLMITGQKPISVVRKETVLHIVRTVYFKHYLRWYTAFVPDVKLYEDQLRERLRDVEHGLKNCADVEVNGMRMLKPAIPPSIVAEPAAPRGPLVPALLTLSAMLFFVSTLFLVQHYANTSWQLSTLIMGGSLVAFVAVFSLFHDASRKTLSMLLTTLLKVFGKHK